MGTRTQLHLCSRTGSLLKPMDASPKGLCVWKQALRVKPGWREAREPRTRAILQGSLGLPAPLLPALEFFQQKPLLWTLLPRSRIHLYGVLASNHLLYHHHLHLSSTIPMTILSPPTFISALQSPLLHCRHAVSFTQPPSCHHIIINLFHHFHPYQSLL